MSKNLLSSMTGCAIWVCLGFGACLRADDPAKSGKPSLTEMSQEVTVLQTLRTLKVTRGQLESLRKLAKDTAQEPENSREIKASEDLRKTMADLHKALVDNNEEQIEELAERYTDLCESENPDLRDDWDITEAARQRAPEVFRLLGPGQVAAYVGSIADDIGDPRDRLLTALDQVRGLAVDKWAATRQEVADEVSRLVAGLDDDKAVRVRDQVVQLLIVARGLKEPEFKAQKPQLEKKAKTIIGDGGPTEILRNVTEYALAELLSNPRLPAALDARLK